LGTGERKLQLPEGELAVEVATSGRRPSGRPAKIMARLSGSKESVPKNWQPHRTSRPRLLARTSVGRAGLTLLNGRISCGRGARSALTLRFMPVAH